MNKYRLIALSVSAKGNRVLRKEDDKVYTESAWNEGRAEELVKEGFLERVIDKEADEAEAKAQEEAEAKAQEQAKKEAKAKAKAKKEADEAKAEEAQEDADQAKEDAKESQEKADEAAETAEKEADEAQEAKEDVEELEEAQEESEQLKEDTEEEEIPSLDDARVTALKANLTTKGIEFKPTESKASLYKKLYGVKG